MIITTAIDGLENKAGCVHMPENFRLFSGSSNVSLAEEIATQLNGSLGLIHRSRFADGETIIRFDEPLQNGCVFLIQSILPDQPQSFIELGLMIDAAKEAGAQKVIAVIPYWGYAKQDRCPTFGEPVSARVMAKWLESAGCDAAIIMDIHSKNAASFFTIPVQFVSAMPLLAQSFSSLNSTQTVVASPDKGGISRAQSFAASLGFPLVSMEKHRAKANESEITQLNGDVREKTVILVDDEINTAGTITKAAQFLIQNGAKQVVAAAVHGVLADPALDRIQSAPIEQVILANTIPISPNRSPKIKTISVASLLATAIEDSLK